MNLIKMKDAQLLAKTKELVQRERRLLTEILHHLREIEKRKLFSDLGYQSLFEYAVKELKYSEGQAGRRIQAMRLIKEFPEIEVKIKSGALSLSNISQAQSYFREAQKIQSSQSFSKAEKIAVLESLENKSTRQADRTLAGKLASIPLPLVAISTKSNEKYHSDKSTEIKFLMSPELKQLLSELRSLMGNKGAAMDFAGLVNFMAKTSIAEMRVKKFGKKRASSTGPAGTNVGHNIERSVTTGLFSSRSASSHLPQECTATPASELHRDKGEGNVKKVGSGNQRYISKELKHQVWCRDGGKCTNCGGQHRLQYDHVKPVALGGEATAQNLRLL